MSKPYDNFVDIKNRYPHLVGRSEAYNEEIDMAWLITELERLRNRVNELLAYNNEQLELRRKYKRQRDILADGLKQVFVAIEEDREAGRDDPQEVLDLIEHFIGKGTKDG